MQKRKTARILLSVIPVTVLITIFALQMLKTPPQYIETLFCIAVVFLLLIFAWIRLVPHLISYMLGEENILRERIGARTYRRCGARELFRIFLIALALRLMQFVFTYIVHFTAFGFTDTFFVIQRLWLEFYDAAVSFPLYHWLSHIFWVVSYNFNHARFLTSYLFTGLAAGALYFWTYQDYDRPVARRALKFFFLFPASCLLMGTLPDGLFLTLSAFCLFFVARKQFVFANLFAMFASMTHPIGVLLLVPGLLSYAQTLLKEYRLHQSLTKKYVREQVWNALSFLLIPMALGFVMLYSKVQFGDAIQLFENALSQREGVGFFGSLTTMIDSNFAVMRSATMAELVRGWIETGSVLLTTVAFSCLLIFSIGKIRTSYALYMLLFLAVVMSTGFATESARILLLCAPLYLSASLLADRKWKDALFTIFGLIFAISFFVAFILGFTPFGA